MQSKKVKKITLSLVLSWVFGWGFGLFFLLGGMCGMLYSHSYLSGLIAIIMGVILVPPIIRSIESTLNFKLSIWLKITIILVCWFILALTNVERNNSTDKLNPVDSLYNQIQIVNDKIDDFDYIDVSNEKKIKLLKENCRSIPVYLKVGKNKKKIRVTKINWDLLELQIKLEISKCENDIDKQKFQNVLKYYNKIQEKYLNID